MNALLRFEAWCAAAVERSFALAFPGSLEPVQIARRLIATIDRAPPNRSGGLTRYVVRIAAKDFARLESERAVLERQWTTMAATLCERAAGHPVAVLVVLVADPALVAGTVVVDAVADGERTPGDVPGVVLHLRARRAGAATATYALPRAGRADPSVVIGRDKACDVVIDDPRVSRRHLRVSAGRTLTFEDLDSSNGTFVNGERCNAGELRAGDTIAIGDTALECFAVRVE